MSKPDYLAAAFLLAMALTACGTPDSADSGVELKIIPANPTIAAGRTQAFTALATYADGREEDVTTTVTWSTSMPSVATIDGDGLAHSFHQGSATITAQGDSMSARTPLTVTAPVVDRIRVEPGDHALSVNGAAQYDAYAILSDNSEQRVTEFAIWDSNNTNVAQVNSSGVVSGQAPGTAHIEAIYGGAQGQTPVTVVPNVLFGGGDMLMARAYVGDSWFNDPVPPLAPRRLSEPVHYPPDAGKLFSDITTADGNSVSISYCQTGDDVGKNVYIGANDGRAAGACGDYSVSPRGFSGVLRSSGATHPDFAAVERPLTAAEYFQMQQNSFRPAPVQVPSLAASIAISYNNPDVPVDPKLNLTSGQLCDIFYGTITNWDQLGWPSKQIVVVYRGDPSAATFALMNHLSFVQTEKGSGHPCAYLETSGSDNHAEPNGPNPTSQTAGFRAVPVFTDAVMPSRLPPGALTAGSNAEAGRLVLNTDGAIGYGEAGDLNLRYPSNSPNPLYPALRLAKVNGFDPLTDLVSPLVQVYDSACVITGTGPLTVQGTGPTALGCAGEEGTSTNKTFTTTTTTGTGAGTTTTTTFHKYYAPGRPTVAVPPAGGGGACSVLVDPNTYADPSNPTICTDGDCSQPNENYPKGYPIVSISYLLAYQSGNGNAAPAIQRLLLAPYSADPAPLQKMGFTTIAGYAPSNLSSCVGQ